MSNTIPGISHLDPARFQPEVQKPDAKSPEFIQTLQNTMSQVEQLSTDAQKQVGNLLRGEGQDIHSAMIAVEKADLAFQLMMQVRNKIVQAYQEVSRMSF